MELSPQEKKKQYDRQYYRVYYLANKEKELARTKTYWKNHKEILNGRQREKYNERYREDPEYRAKQIIKGRKYRKNRKSPLYTSRALKVEKYLFHYFPSIVHRQFLLYNKVDKIKGRLSRLEVDNVMEGEDAVLIVEVDEWQHRPGTSTKMNKYVTYQPEYQGRRYRQICDYFKEQGKGCIIIRFNPDDIRKLGTKLKERLPLLKEKIDFYLKDLNSYKNEWIVDYMYFDEEWKNVLESERLKN